MFIPFEVAGQFGGFVFTDAGKRRMLLRCGEENRLLKVPRLLRRRIVGKFAPGEAIRVAGTEERDPETGVVKLVVARVLPDSAAPTVSVTPAVSVPVHSFAPCTIRVCAKKNCWRQGGRELYEALEHQLDALGRPEGVKLKAVGCLDRCKLAPNVECGTHVRSRCSPNEAAAIIARVTGQALQPA